MYQDSRTMYFRIPDTRKIIFSWNLWTWLNLTLHDLVSANLTFLQCAIERFANQALKSYLIVKIALIYKYRMVVCLNCLKTLKNFTVLLVANCKTCKLQNMQTAKHANRKQRHLKILIKRIHIRQHVQTQCHRSYVYHCINCNRV